VGVNQRGEKVSVQDKKAVAATISRMGCHLVRKNTGKAKKERRPGKRVFIYLKMSRKIVGNLKGRDERVKQGRRRYAHFSMVRQYSGGTSEIIMGVSTS